VRGLNGEGDWDHGQPDKRSAAIMVSGIKLAVTYCYAHNTGPRQPDFPLILSGKPHLESKREGTGDNMLGKHAP
jgi:hypothetical protein